MWLEILEIFLNFDWIKTFQYRLSIRKWDAKVRGLEVKETMQEKEVSQFSSYWVTGDPRWIVLSENQVQI